MLTVVRPACALVVSVVLFAACALPATGSDWPSFRGPDRSGVSKETGLLTKWPTEGPPLRLAHARRGTRLREPGDCRRSHLHAWATARRRARDRDEYVVCFDRQTGKRLWSTKTGKPWTSGQPNWQSSREHADRRRRHGLRRDSVRRVVRSRHGQRPRAMEQKPAGGSRRQEGGRLGLQRIGADRRRPPDLHAGRHRRPRWWRSTRRRGTSIWKAAVPENRGAGHSSIMISEIDGTRVYVQDTASGPIGVRAKDGKVLWSFLRRPGSGGRDSHADRPRRSGLLLDRLQAGRHALQAGAGQRRRGDTQADLSAQSEDGQQARRRGAGRRLCLRRHRRLGRPVVCRPDDGQHHVEAPRLGPRLGRDGRRRRTPLYPLRRRHDGPRPGHAEGIHGDGLVQSPRQRRAAELVASGDPRRQALPAGAGPCPVL